MKVLFLFCFAIFLVQFELQQLIKEPTHILIDSPSCVDYLLSNSILQWNQKFIPYFIKTVTIKQYMQKLI